MDNELKYFLIERGISEETINSNSGKISTILNSVDPKTSKRSLYEKIARYLSKPDILTQVDSFLGSSIKYLANNMRNVSNEVAVCRMSICEPCEFYDKESVRCNYCGCFLRIKTQWASEKCPIGKWNSESEKDGELNVSAAPSGCGCDK